MSIPGAASPLFLATTAGAAAGFEISRSLRFNPGDSATLTRTQTSVGNRKIFTISLWAKKSQIGTTYEDLLSCRTGGQFRFIWEPNGNLEVYSNNGSITTFHIDTVALFRDPSAWYHFVVSVDATNTSVKFYVNGVELTDFVVHTAVQNADTIVNTATAHTIGKDPSGSYFSGYLAEFNFIDGQALDSSSFGEFDDNGVWQAIDTAGLTFGTNGFRLKFADNSGTTATTLGKDTSGNSNNFTPNNLSVTAGSGNDSLVDSPTNGTASTGGDAGGVTVGNYATLNALNLHSDITLSNGNLQIAKANNSYRSAFSTIGVSSGKWYFEVKPTANANEGVLIGIDQTGNPSRYIGQDNGNNGFSWKEEGKFYSNDSNVSYGGSGFATNDIIGVAVDLDNGTLTFYKNNTSQGVATSSLPSGTYFFGVSVYHSSTTAEINFGQRAFSNGSVPSGYKALCTSNLSTPTIADGSKYFDTKLWTGNGGTQAISNYNFSPDLVWYKSRSSSIYNHGLFDIVRGTSKQLFSNNTSSEGTYSGVTSFNSDGFTLGSDAGGNLSSGSYVAWAWDAGTSTVTNNDGSIASQVRAQPSAGFSICTYSGNGTAGESVGHGLSAAPEFIICKCRNSGVRWAVYTKTVGPGNTLVLDSTGGPTGGTGVWGNVNPTNSVFTVGNDPEANGSGNTYVAYCFAPVEGYSAMGSYVGNGNTAPRRFVYLGFRPAFVLIKATSISGKSWIICDYARDGFNNNNDTLAADVTNTENDVVPSANSIALLSNGFQHLNDNSRLNESGATYIYYAVAENPFQANGGLAR